MRVNDKIEMMISDCAENINRYDFSIESVLELQGWRLPTIEELRLLLLLHKNSSGNFSNDWYMTNEVTSSYDNYCIHFGTSEELLRKTEESHWGCCRARLVSDLS